MSEYKRLALLIVIMIGVAIVVGATALGVFYEAALERERQRLANFVESQARLILALPPSRFSEILEEQRRLREQTAGRTAELQLARRDGDVIEYLTPARGSDRPPESIRFGGPVGQPMTEALSGRSGTMVGRDYVGRRVLAAYEPLPSLNLGLVAKIDMAEINEGYLRAAVVAGLVSLVAVAAAAVLFFWLADPVIRRLRESETRFRELFENMGSGVAVYEAVAGGSDFVFKGLNRAGEKSERLRRQEVIGKRLTEVYPRIREFGLVDALERVWRTGNPEHMPAREYRDESRKDWWRENHIYKLPSGEVVALFDDVSERVRAEQALRQSEARYRTLVEEQPDPICQFLPDTTLTFVNRAYAAFYGRAPEELAGRRWLDFALTVERPRFLDELSTFTPEHPERHEETRSTGADGMVHWYLCHIHAFFDDAGKALSFQTFATDITERKRAEEALAESERRAREQLLELETLYRTAPIGLALYDRSLNFVRVNEMLADINGRSIEEHLGRHAWDVVPQLREAVDPQFQKVLKTGEAVHFEVSGETPKALGVRRDWIVQYYPLKGADGSVVAIGGIVQEVTERKRAVRALLESEARYRTVGEAVPYGVWICNATGGIEYVSGSFLDLIGKTLDEVKPRGWLDRLPPEDVKPALEAWRTCVRTGGEWAWEHRVKGADGIYRTILSLGRPVRDEQGQITSWGGFNLDISERKRIEQELAKQLGLLTAITNSAADAIFASDRNGRVTFINSAAERMFGWSRQELMGQVLHEIIHNHFPDGRPYPASACPLGRVVATGETVIEHEDMFFRKDGSLIEVACSNAPLMIEGRIAGSILLVHDITHRKRAQEALWESEARLRRTVENAPFPIMVHADDGEVVHVSEALLTLTGYTRKEVGTIAAWTERAYGERREVVRTGIDRLYALDRTVDEGEFLVRTKDGRTRVWAFHSAPLGGDGRGRRLVVSMAADVTERKQAEQELRESEFRMRALLDASQDEILLVSTQGEVLAINKAAERRLARRTRGADPVGAHLDRLLPEDQAEQRMDLVQQVAATAILVHWEVQIRGGWFEFWFYPVLQPNKPVSEVAVYAREITEQRKSQAELRKLFQAIQQSPMSVVITDRNGVIEYVNPEFTKVTAYNVEEAIGQTPRILKSGQTPPELYADLWNTIAGGGVWRGELLNKRKNGELFWELASIAPVKDERDTITNYVAVKQDITERRQTEEQLRHSQKMQAVGQLTGGIAHDFNNLLTIIIGNLQLLELRLNGDVKAREYLDDALWSARRGGDLTHRLLAFARKQPLKPAVIDLNEIVRGMTDLLRRTLGVGIRIEESLASDLWQAFADRGELERALVNLAVNSRDAMRNVGTLTLETRNAVVDHDYAEQHAEVSPGDYVLLAVTDTGTGMPPEIVERVFEPFFTTKEVGRGSGLGLSMVYGFAKQSRGHVGIYSRVGQGTTVKLYLPRASSLSVPAKDDRPDVPFEGFGKKVVLVVEDEAKLRKVALKMLKRLGLRTMQAETAKEALDLLDSARVDALFTDIELPGGMNGIELADAVRKMHPNIKVLFTTGYAGETVLQDERLHDKGPWLLKPYSHIELARALKELFMSS